MSEDRPDQWIECFAPATGLPIARVAICQPDDVQAVVARSRLAQEAWGQKRVKERARAVLKLRDLVVSEGPGLAALLSLECGKPEVEAYMSEVFTLVDLMTYFCKRAPSILSDRGISLHLMKHRRSVIHYQPRGVVGIISPWNFPLVIPAGDMVMALLAGNGVVIKPSEVTPLIALRLVELCEEAGLPQGLVAVVPGGGLTGAALVEAGVDKVVFTGSVATGRRVAQMCASRLIPCALELGGKAPAVVLPGADIERTARALVYGAFCNSGQVCVSVERAYVHADVYEALVERVVLLTGRLRQGDPAAGQVDLGAVIHGPQVQTAQAQVDDAVGRGGQIRTGGTALGGPGQFYPPTVLSGVPQDARVMQEETFGPLLPIHRVHSEAEAIGKANDSHLGLMAYVFAGSSSQGERVARQLVAGTVMVNDVLNTYAMPETPWAGLKQSGLGRVHSADSLIDMCQTRHINLPLLPALKRELWWYPYGARTYGLMRAVVSLLFGRGVGRFRSAGPGQPGSPRLPQGLAEPAK